jgi:predicted HAD superfamily Cof-like phosphohydrolase
MRITDNNLKQKFKYNISVAEFINLFKDLPQENLISDYISIEPINQVALFQRVFGDEVNELGSIPSVDKRKLRIDLLLEEVGELAIDGYGLAGYFALKCKETYDKSLVKTKLQFGFEDIDVPEDTLIFNPEEVLDAICDLLVVTYGGACINGHSSIINGAFDETMRSNMSKSCKTLDQALYTIAQYHKEGRDTYYKVVDGLYIIYDSTTNKILKNKDEKEGFFTPDYNSLLNNNK